MSEARNGETFVDVVMSGRAFPEDIEDWVDHWHDADGAPWGKEIPLHVYLGMAPDEYALWVEQPDSLRFIIASHVQDVPVSDLLVSQDDYALAARAEAHEDANQVLLWLVKTGRVSPEQASHS
ncbi:hypothetical protein [Rhodococcus pyridinivorans]|uniref:Uncharacterized protein n=1 Tax=Rhodococcus pyridinivorans AK37 TaxID=1114960 RepID=H0JV39_9NOCA|nr:hypothetical protein [Rhodococcus pyridinivorans]EHK82135.1 hypothetical protein AK37_17850 [Rhodococcus pyridinivorans AK37]MCD2140415.1 hypothetical protein [Rhodococcus pyridinivorans]